MAHRAVVTCSCSVVSPLVAYTICNGRAAGRSETGWGNGGSIGLSIVCHDDLPSVHRNAGLAVGRRSIGPISKCTLIVSRWSLPEWPTH